MRTVVCTSAVGSQPLKKNNTGFWRLEIQFQYFEKVRKYQSKQFRTQIQRLKRKGIATMTMNMAQYAEYTEQAKVFHKFVAEIDMELWTHKYDLKSLFKEVHDPKKDEIMDNFEGTMKKWNDMVKKQRALLNKLQQQQMLASIEVVGLPEEYGKDIVGVAYILSKILHVNIERDFVTGFHRLGELRYDNEPRTLVVHLINQNIRKRILYAAQLCSLRVDFSDRPVYINEHLTGMNRVLLERARREAERLQINSVWVEDGKILAKRNDRSLVYEIKNEADVKNMAQL